eukprot:TRINITY_DN45547_c0_g1_i6.p1 TRINITY_DN45547_c0_g1~~TRINITY_DN45547_c0_g1_i6.p1  ORF type:complete len:104 (+),score=2.95 TRINITY_DN45547_c0_g1_i6:188-499(+)
MEALYMLGNCRLKGWPPKENDCYPISKPQPNGSGSGSEGQSMQTAAATPSGGPGSSAAPPERALPKVSTATVWSGTASAMLRSNNHNAQSSRRGAGRTRDTQA